MSVSGSLAGISFSGISSGLDTTAIINALLQADQVPINNLKAQQGNLNTTLSALQTYAQGLTALGTAASALNNSTAFSPVTASSSDSTVASITTTTGGQPGNYNLSVTALAQAEKISTSAQNDTTSALNLTGTIVVNGKGVQIGGSDTLTTIAQKINGVGAGVTASLISGGTGSSYLTLTANTSGLANKIQISDMQGTVANTLGLLTGSATIRQATPGNGALSASFSNQTSNLATLLNANGIGAQSFTINGVQVQFDPNNTTLQGLVTAINSANTGATASIASNTDSNNNTTYQLKVTGITSQTDDTGFLKSIGILQQSYGKEILGAQDAAYSLDGVALTSSTNKITNVIQGTTLTLLKGTVANPGTSTISIAQDTSTIDKNVQAFVDAYNQLQQYVGAAQALNTTTFATGPLFGNNAVDQTQQQIASNLFSNVAGAQPPYNNLTSVGMALDSNGNLTFDSSKLNTALSTNPNAVTALFKATGTSSNPAMSYVSNTSKTQPSAAGSYAINISQVATQASFTAGAAQTQPLAANELLTFNGSLFGNTNYTLLLPQGETQAALVNQINSDAKLKGLVTASVSNGKLTISSRKFGANGNFTVSSDTPATNSSSGLQGGTAAAGLDVQGTINGEAASGNGQYLTGNTGNATTDGLQISYNGSATGAIGSISFSKGIGSLFNDLVANFTDPANGLVTTAENGINSQLTDLASQITQLTDEMKSSKALLQNEFNAMEQALAQLKNQQASLSGVLGTSSSSSSTGSSSTGAHTSTG